MGEISNTYGVRWGDGPDTIVFRCGTLLTAIGRAIDSIQDGESDAVDVVELEVFGPGPVYPSRTVESWALWTGPTGPPADKRVAYCRRLSY